MQKIIKVLALILAAVMLVCSVGCSQGSESLLELDGHTLSLNAYEFLLSRMKGVLVSLYAQGSGSNPLQSTYWNTIADRNGTTYDEYYKDMVLKEAYKYVEALYLFDKNGLELSQEELDGIDKTIDELTKNAGSVNDFNNTLSAFGFNAEMLKQLYTDEAKIAKLKKTLFGERGELVSEDEKNGFYADNYVAFRQVFVATYYYENETDSNGDTVYYDKDGRIAYDDENGFGKKDEFDKYILDSDGRIVQYGEDGRIAYDKENGQPKRKKDSNGNYVTAKCEGEQLANVIGRANQLLSLAKDTDNEEFEGLIGEFSETESDELTYLRTEAGYYSTRATSLAYMDDISLALTKMKLGDVEIIKSPYGYHIVRRYELEDKAYDSADDEKHEIFKDFYDLLVTYEFGKACAEYDQLVKVDKEVFEKSVSMNDIGYNKYY